MKTLGRKNSQDPRNGWLSFDGEMIGSVWLVDFWIHLRDWFRFLALGSPDDWIGLALGFTRWLDRFGSWVRPNDWLEKTVST